MTMELKYGATADSGFRDAAASENKTLPIHRWIPWIAGFSAQFVQDCIEAYLPRQTRSVPIVLDPFAGVGTTLIEAFKANCDAVGYEVNPYAALAARAKLQAFDASPTNLRAEIEAFRIGLKRFEAEVDDAWNASDESRLEILAARFAELRPQAFKSRISFFSKPVEAKFLYGLARTQVLLEPERTLFRAALGATMVAFSNYSYEPSLGSRPGSGKPLIENASVADRVSNKLDEMLTDVEWARQNYGYRSHERRREIVEASYFDSDIKPGAVSLIITSPPYMNNYHYVRNTRPQLHWLDLLNGAKSADLEDSSFGKFWQTVRQREPVELDFQLGKLSGLVDQVRIRNQHKGYYGGSGWANYVATYMNDSNRLMKSLKRHLKRGGVAVLVVGNSIIQGIEFPIDQFMAELAGNYRLKVEEIAIVRTKRVGNSIIDSSVRNGDENGHRNKTQLYDAAVVLRS